MSKKVGLSEFTSQRLAELKARRAEAEASDNNQNLFSAEAALYSESPPAAEVVRKPSPPPLATKPTYHERPAAPVSQPSTAIIEPFSQTINSKLCASVNTNVRIQLLLLWIMHKYPH